MKKGALGELIDRCFRIAGPKATVLLADRLMRLGFEQAAKAGVSICIDDMHIPTGKEEILASAQAEVRETEDQYSEGLITVGEKYNKVVDIWAKVTEEISAQMIEELGTEDVSSEDGKKTRKIESFNSIYMMVDSGARGSTPRSVAGWHAWSDGQAVRRDHRDADYRELPRGLDRPAVLHLDSRCS